MADDASEVPSRRTSAPDDELTKRLTEAVDAIDAARAAITQVADVRAAFGLGGRSDLTPEEWQEASARLGAALARLRIGMALVNDWFGLRTAQERLLRYLLAHRGQVISGEALAGVAAIYEWARRVRELRVEQGWPIESGLSNGSLKPNEYLLNAERPNQALADKWRLAQAHRRSGGSGKDRLLRFLTAIHPAAADQEQLGYVARIPSWQRRMRELDEEGWQIRSNVDEPELAPGTYRLASTTRRPPRARQAIALRYKILERDRFTCQDCQARRGDPGIRLEVHHKRLVSQGGDNSATNLVTLCDGCHAGRHAVLRGTTDDELRRPEVEGRYAD